MEAAWPSETLVC